MGVSISASWDRSNNHGIVRVLVICRSTLHREGMRRVLDSHPRLNVVGSVASTRDALGILQRERPDVALFELVDLRDVAQAGFIIERSGLTKFVGIADAISEDTLIAALEAGMGAVIGPEAGVGELVTIFDAVQCGEFPCSPKLAAILQRRLHHLARSRAQLKPSRLTPRERDIMVLVEEGLSNGEISQRLCVELSTVKNHLHNIFEKLGVHTRSEAVSQLNPPRDASGDGSRSPLAVI